MTRSFAVVVLLLSTGLASAAGETPSRREWKATPTQLYVLGKLGEDLEKIRQAEAQIAAAKKKLESDYQALLGEAKVFHAIPIGPKEAVGWSSESLSFYVIPAPPEAVAPVQSRAGKGSP